MNNVLYIKRAMENWIQHKSREATGTSIIQLLDSKQCENRRYYIKSIGEVIQFLVVNKLSFRGNYNDLEEKETGLFENLFEYTMKKDKTLAAIAKTMPSKCTVSQS